MLKAQFAAEVAHLRKVRPDLKIVAVAVAAPDNWTFLKTLRPDERAVDFYHACEHLGEASDHAVASSWYEKYRAILRDDEKGVDKVRHLRDKATTETAVLECDLRFFRKHKRRMSYASLKAKGCGSGVVEAANKVPVNQRMKRARWSMRPERPHLQGVDDVGPLRRRVAGDGRNECREQQPDRPRLHGVLLRRPAQPIMPSCYRPLVSHFAIGRGT